MPAIGAVLRRAQLFARCDPAVPGQLERLAARGVAFVMLPMFRDPAQVADAIQRCGPGVRVVPLVETAAAVERIEEVVAVPGVEEVHVGLNDLSLELGLANRFAVLVHPAVERVAAAARAAGVRLGLGGIGRAGQEDLPVPASLIYARHAALGAGAALLSRSFLEGGATLAEEIARARRELATWSRAGAAALEEAADRLRALTSRASTW